MSRAWASVAVATGLTSAAYWLIGMTFSPDWTFHNHYYFAQVTAQQLAAGHYPLWDPGLGAGNLFLEHYGIAPYLLSAPLIYLLGPDGGVRAFMMGLHLLIGLGMYCAAARSVGPGWSAWVGSVAYLFSFRVIFELYLNGSFTHALAAALLPWMLWAYEGSRGQRPLPWVMATIGMLALAIWNHPQNALKLYLVLGLWIGITRWEAFRGRLMALAGHLALVFTLPVLLAGYKIAEWLTLYAGVNALNMRQEAEPWRTPFTNLFVLPGYIVGLVSQRVTGWPLVPLSYIDAEASDYVGFTVALLAVGSLGLLLRRRAPQGQALAALLGICAAFYYVFASLPAIASTPGWAAFVSVRYRWMLVVSFALALLAAHGAHEVEAWSRRRARSWPRFALTALLLADLPLLMLVLVGAVGTHGRPADLPLLAEWRRSGLPRPAAREHRVLDLVGGGSNATVAALVPLAIGIPSATPDIANALAMPNEYSAYYASLVHDLRTSAPAAGLADRLALLNAGTVRIDPSAMPRDPVARETALERLRRESGLTPLEIAGATGTFFENARAVGCLVPRAAIAIIGEDLQAEAVFEHIVGLPDFRLGSVLPLLVPNPARLPPDAIIHLGGALRVDGGPLPKGWTALSLEAIQGLLTDEGANAGAGPGCEVTRPTPYAVDLRLAPRDGPGFVFLSQAYFEQPGYTNPWVAEDDLGTALVTVKTGAGLTAIWAPAAVRNIRLRFQLPLSKQIGAWVTAVAWAGFAAAWSWTLARRSPGGGRDTGPGGGP